MYFYWSNTNGPSKLFSMKYKLYNWSEYSVQTVLFI